MHTTDEKLQVNAELRVAGKKTSFVSLRIDQEFGEHHQFWIQLDYDTLHKSFMDNPLDNADLVGEKVYIKFIQGTDEANYSIKNNQNKYLSGWENRVDDCLKFKP